MEELIRDLRSYMDETGESQSSIAKKMDISGAALSQILNGKYPNSEGEVIDKIKSFLHMVESTKSIKKIGFTQTNISKKILSTLGYCHMQHMMCIIYGDAGVGKTITAEQYESSNPDVIKVNLNPGASKPKGFLKKLCKALKMSSPGTEDDIYERLVERLTKTNKLLIIDEAQLLKDATLEYVKCLYDDTKIAVALVGNEDIYERIAGQQDKKNARLYSRSSMRCPVDAKQIKKADIDMIFEGLEIEARQYLYRFSRQSNWGLRGAVDLYNNAAANSNVSAEGLKAMTEAMGIEIK